MSPNFSSSTSAGAEAPKVSMPIVSPFGPARTRQGSVLPASIVATGTITGLGGLGYVLADDEVDGTPMYSCPGGYRL